MNDPGHQEAGATRGRRALAVLAALIVVAALATWLLWPGAETAAPAVARPTLIAVTTPAPRPAYCDYVPAKPFTPTHIRIAGVGNSIPVLALGRDAKDLPSTPPLNTAGKTQFGWDKPPGLKPGSASGNVLLNAHTWPDGSALGNRLLTNLNVDDQIVIEGDHSHLCYRVTKRVEVPADKGYLPYYTDIGSPQVTIIVCSGTRVGPGDWNKRTIWFAAPATA